MRNYQYRRLVICNNWHCYEALSMDDSHILCRSYAQLYLAKSATKTTTYESNLVSQWLFIHVFMYSLQ